MVWHLLVGRYADGGASAQVSEIAPEKKRRCFK